MIKIFIDQGHNPAGINAGAEGNGMREQDINYEVGKYLQEFLSNDPRFDVKVSRETIDTSLGYNNTTSLKARVDMANEWGADWFISIHSNASVNPDANGSEVYVYKADSPAYSMANDVLNGIVSYVGTKDNGVKINRTLFVLRKTKMPAILVELGYITNVRDAEKLRNNRSDFAYGIYRGILNYFGYQTL